jgi:site-specific DNA-methyltransferase (adenine-specific)
MASRNRTLRLSPDERKSLRPALGQVLGPSPIADLRNRIFCQSLESALPHFPLACVDLLFLDPPYNLDKTFAGARFRQQDPADYAAWFEGALGLMLPLLRPGASVYVCGDWQTSVITYGILARHLTLRNRITWEREKGRGAKSNWKNALEDIWFCTLGEGYTFNVEAVKLKRRVLAPYRRADGAAKDWQTEDEGPYRLTHPSNLWTDISVPFWSMPENTDHPTQKPEKLLAKLILASSQPGDLILDPFLGSGTSAVVAKKLGRAYIGIESQEEYALLALKRLALAETNQRIQGYHGGVFWERNSHPANDQEDET